MHLKNYVILGEIVLDLMFSKKKLTSSSEMTCDFHKLQKFTAHLLFSFFENINEIFRLLGVRLREKSVGRPSPRRASRATNSMNIILAR